MRKKINYIFAIAILLFGLCACGDTVKYVASDADVNEGEIDSVGAGYVTDAGDDCESHLAVASSSDSDVYEVWEDEKIPVYVCGAVISPGVYYVNSTSLKQEALDLAGGFTEDAAIDYINLAETVVSGEKIYFPYAYELQEGYNMQPEQTDNGSSRYVNINTATKEQLMTLPGIGESKAEAIIKYRDKNGPFQNIQDITNIPGIKEGVYNNIKDHIVVS
ncbi:MAG: hypothetical protein E7257_04440 [Lachnospiraceae bacterium]|nr:hypothetical protein [Lachnospiraceae bacterium]